MDSQHRKNSNTSIASKQQIEHKLHSATELFQFVLRCIFIGVSSRLKIDMAKSGRQEVFRVQL